MHNTKLVASALALQNVFNLDIDPHMIVIEKMVAKYYDRDKYTGNVFYIKGTRDPEPNRGKIELAMRNNLATTVPWHPFLAISLLKDMFIYFQYLHCEDPSLFITNPLGDGIQLYIDGSFTTDTKIVKEFIPQVTDADMREICNMFLDMYAQVLRPVLEKYGNNILNLDTTTYLYKLLIYEDVRIFRFKEAILHGDICSKT